MENSFPVVPGYEVLSAIEDGLYQARQQSLGRQVRLRVFDCLDATIPVDDVQSAARLNHPNILRILDGGRVGPIFFVATEHVDGLSLQRVLDVRGRLPIPLACAFLVQVCAALGHAHRLGLVHRHIKPSNILLTAAWLADAQVPTLEALQERPWLVKVAQLGQYRRTLEPVAGLLPPGVAAEYLAPEQLEAAWQPDPRVDLYGVGCTLYALLSGRAAFAANKPSEVLDKVRWLPARPVNLARPETPIRLAELIRKLMAKKPAERCQTASEVETALTEFAGEIKPAPLPAASAEVSTRAATTQTQAAAPAPAPAVAGEQLIKMAALPGVSPLSKSHQGTVAAAVAAAKASEPATAASVAPVVPPPAVASVSPAEGSHHGTAKPQPEREGWRARLTATRESLKSPMPFVRPTLPSRETHHDTPKSSTADTVSTSAPVPPEAPTKEPSRTPTPPRTPAPAALSKEHTQLADQIERSDYLGALLTVQELLAKGADETAQSAKEYLDSVTGEWARFDKHTDGVTSLAIAASGGLFASGGRDKTVRVWELATGKLRHTIATEQPVLSVSITRDSRQVLAGVVGGFIHGWDLVSGKELRRIRSYDGDVLSVAAAPVGPLMIAGNRRASAIIWDLTTGRGVRALAGHSAEVSQAVWSSTARWLLTCSSDGSVRLWGGEKFPERGHLVLPNRRTAKTLAFVGENQGALGQSDGAITIHNLNDFKETRRLSGHVGTVHCLVASTDNERILSGGADHTVRYWDVAGKELAVFRHADEVHAVALSPDGRFALSGSKDGKIRMWKLH